MTRSPLKYLTALTATLSGLVVLFISSCSIKPKYYPANKPFVYETNINIEGNFSSDEKAALKAKLKNQLDDSIRVRTIGKIFSEVLKYPPAYDRLRADHSVTSMHVLLNSLGYYRDSITYDTTLVIKERTGTRKADEMRTTINFLVKPGKLITIDSVSYSFTDSADDDPNRENLQQLTDNSIKEAEVKKGEPFAKQNISAEIDRLVSLYRNNGYLRFTRDEMVAVWDTLDPSLLRPAIDPFEQIILLEKLRKKRENPTANIEFTLRPGFDSSRLTRYYVGNTTIYPDYSIDSASYQKKITVIDSGNKIIRYTNLFKSKFIPENIYFKKGDVYSQEVYLKTINRFNALRAWRLVNIEQLPRPESDTVDFKIILTPDSKYSFTTNLEVSSSNNTLIQGNLLGLGVNATLLNKNFAHSSNQSSLNLRYNTELSTKGNFIAAQQAGISYGINFPRMIPKFNFIKGEAREKAKTSLALAFNNTNRKDYFVVNSFNLSWGYDFAWKNKSFRLTLPNIEYSTLQKKDSLVALIERNPSFKNIFNQGLVFSIQEGFKVTGGKGKNINIFSTNLEESGLMTGFIKGKLFDSLYRFIKIDGEFVRSMMFGKKQLVTRVYSGVGVALKTDTRNSDIQMPYFRQFFAGGPNSMRAWNLRTLGPGSVIKSKDDAPFRFGDFMFETNLELRFPFAKIAGYNITSAVFSDIGNVWFIRPNADFPGGQLTSLKKFLNDMAVGVGTGLRFDFEFLVVRLDYSLKARNPTPLPDDSASQGKWFYKWNPGSLLHGVFQLGINYPFIRY